jgi:O-antigen/teichoic acid export membrane protein
VSVFNNNRVGEFGKTLLRFASSQAISNLLRLISGFIVVKFIDPELYGQFAGVGIFMGYISLGSVGIINGLSRELPYELGRGNNESARQMASSVYVLSTIISITASVVFLFFSIYFFILGKTLTGTIYLSYVIISGLFFFNTQFLPTLYRTNKDFDSLSKQNIRVGLGNLLTVILVYFFSIYGLIARGIILAVYQFVLLNHNKPYKLNFIYHFKHFVNLFKTGFPIFIVGQVNPLWTTIINSFIFSIGGALNFGLYALSTIVQSTFGVIPASFGGVVYPRMSIMYGEGKSIAHIIKAHVKTTVFQFSFMLVFAILGFFLLPILVPYILPKYTNGIEAAQWMLFIPVVQSIGLLNHIYNVIKKQKWYFISLLIGASVGSLFVFLNISINGFNLIVFPQGLLIGMFIQQILSLVFIRFIIYK